MKTKKWKKFIMTGIQVNNNELLKEEGFFIKLISTIITLLSIAAAIFHLYGGAFRPLSGDFERIGSITEYTVKILDLNI
mgnify:CR=1 FL=1